MPPRITIACSGLGHIRRGNETWASDVATALHAAGAQVLLLGGGPRPEADCPYERLPHLRRDFPLFRRFVPWSRRYLIEQLSFLPALRRRLRAGGRRIVHLCDPDLALQLQKRTRRGELHVAFKDGMRLGPHWCRRIEFVQVLAPYYRDVDAREAGVDTANWFVIPHLVDVRLFTPPAGDDRARARQDWPELNLPAEAFVVLAIGDFSATGQKRLEWLVQEVAALPASARAHLVLAGQASAEEFAAFEAQAAARLGSRVRLLQNLPRTQVSRLYRVADVFAHAALREPFGIVFLEAMASGLPLLGHTWDVTRWIIGEAGRTADMTVAGAAAAVLRDWAGHPEERRALGRTARDRATDRFSPACLVPLYLELYERMSRVGPAGA